MELTLWFMMFQGHYQRADLEDGGNFGYLHFDRSLMLSLWGKLELIKSVTIGRRQIFGREIM